MKKKDEQRSRRKGSGWLWILLCALWGVVVFIAYYVVHKPVDIALTISLAGLALLLLGWVGTLALAHLIGRLIKPLLEDLPARPALALRLGFGLAILGYFVLALGAVGGYWSLLAWIVTAIALPFGLPSLAADLRSSLPRIPSGSAQKALASFVCFTLLVAVLLALAPPTAWDSLVYHLTGPKLYLQAGGLHHDVDLPYLGFPQAGSMLFLWGQMLAGPELAQLLHLTFAILTLALLAYLVRRVSSMSAWLAAALLLGVPTAAMLASWAYVEWITMYAVLASLVLILEKDLWTSGRSKLLPALAGFFAALAINSKYTAVGAILGLCVAMIAERRTRRGLGTFLGALALAVLPYLMKNLILTGNPVYPFFLGGKFWDAQRAAWYSRGGTGLNILQLILAPWEATVFGIEGGVVQGHPPFSATMGPALLALLPLAAFRFRERSDEARRIMRSLGMVCAIAFGAWLVQLAYSELLVQTRLLFPVLPLLIILAAAGFDGLTRGNRAADLARLALGTLIGLMLALNVIEAGAAFVDASPARVLLGQQTESGYLASRLGEHSFAMAELNQLEEGSRVRFLWEPRSYYCARHVQCEPDALLDRWWHTWQYENDVEAIAEAWYAEGVTHVLIFHAGSEAIRAAGFDPLTEEAWAGLAGFVDAHLFKLTVREGGYALYALVR